MRHKVGTPKQNIKAVYRAARAHNTSVKLAADGQS